MTADIFLRLVVILATIALGAALPRLPVFRAPRHGEPDAATAGLALAQIATYVLIPALLFRTMARMDLAHLPWPVIQGYFVPAMVFTLIVVLAQGRRDTRAAAPATRATAAIYGNAVQMGIPMATALFGEPGLAIHVALVSLHGILLLTLLTLLAEYALARGQAGNRSTWRLLGTMLRSAVLHPVVLPVLLGLLWNAGNLPWPVWLDQVLGGLGVAVVPLCLLLIGMNLAQYGLRGNWRPALPLVLIKLFIMPAGVLVAARWGFGLRGLPLQVAVMMAALPVGANALIMAQRYRLLQAEATVAIVLSTVAFAMTAPAWFWVVTRLA